MKSMTGFGTAFGSLKAKPGGIDKKKTRDVPTNVTIEESMDVTIEVTVRTVNGRFLEPRFHLPREYLIHESEMKKKMQECMRRGTVDIFVTRKVSLHGGLNFAIQEDVVLKYQRELQRLSRKLKTPDAPSLALLLSLPEVIQSRAPAEVGSGEAKVLLQVFDKAMAACLKERSREGESLRKELMQLLKQLREQAAIISKNRQEVEAGLQVKYLAKIHQKMKLLNQEVDSQRLLQEVVIQLDKSDIAEELSRLEEHLTNYLEILKSSHAEGKKLDFYTQELLREMNTIGSKSQVAEVTQSVVQSKTLIERLREQVQNVE